MAIPALAGRTSFGCLAFATNHSCHHHLLGHLRNAPSSVVSSRFCRLNVTCGSTNLGQAASVGLPLMSAGEESQIPSTSGITWADVALQGPRLEMEDAVVVRVDALNGFNYAAVFDGHAGFSSVKFLREELYRECTGALQNGLLLESNDFSIIEKAITSAFVQADSRLLSWLEETGNELESGSTATVMFLGSDSLIVAHVGDSRAAHCMQWKAILETTSQQKDMAMDLLKGDVTQLKADLFAYQMQLDKYHVQDNAAATPNLHEQLQDLKIHVEQKIQTFADAAKQTKADLDENIKWDPHLHIRAIISHYRRHLPCPFDISILQHPMTHILDPSSSSV